MSKEANRRAGVESLERACGLCGNTGELTKTECCDNWICDDEQKYASSPSHPTCYRNHKKYTLCAFHHDKRHEGEWKLCLLCMEELGEQGVYEEFATGEYNFDIIDSFLGCNLCGDTGGCLTKIECCKNWVCYKCCFKHGNSLCAFHHSEGHEGKWRGCIKCKEEFSEEDYEEFVREEFDFEEWDDAP